MVMLLVCSGFIKLVQTWLFFYNVIVFPIDTIGLVVPTGIHRDEGQFKIISINKCK